MFGNDELLTIKETLSIAKVSRHTLYRDIKAGNIPAIYIGRNVRIKQSDALKYAEEKGNSKSVAYYKDKVSENG